MTFYVIDQQIPMKNLISLIYEVLFKLFSVVEYDALFIYLLYDR